MTSHLQDSRGGFRKCDTERNQPGMHDAARATGEPAAGSWMKGRRDTVAVVRRTLGRQITYAAIPVECPPPVHQAGLAWATGPPETAFTAALTVLQPVGQSRAGLDEARRTVTDDARVSA